jgi:hypothetical protein
LPPAFLLCILLLLLLLLTGLMARCALLVSA